MTQDHKLNNTFSAPSATKLLNESITMTYRDCASMLGQAGIKPPGDWDLTGKLTEGCLDMELGVVGVSSIATNVTLRYRAGQGIATGVRVRLPFIDIDSAFSLNFGRRI